MKIARPISKVCSPINWTDFFLSVGFMIVMNGCSASQLDSTNSSSSTTTATFSDVNEQILQPKCISCHASGSPNFSSYDTLMSGTVVVAGNASSSLIYQVTSNGTMPQTGSPLTTSELQLLASWINAGALNNSNLPPNAPTNLTATTSSATAISLSWSLPSGPISQIIIERSNASDSGFLTLTTINSGTTSQYTDTGLSMGTTYYYRISAANANGTSQTSTVTSATTLSTPAAPINAVATTASSTQIDITWSDQSQNENGFKVEQATSSNGTYTVVSNTAANVTNFSQTNLSPSTTYYYRVLAFNDIGDSVATSVTSATTSAAATQAPAAPSALAVGTVTASQISLTWTDNSNDESGFKLERSTNSNGPFTVVSTPLANSTSVTDSNLTAATTYYYRIYAYNNVGNSSTSSIINATTLINAPSAPSALSLSAASTTQINLTWTDNSNNESQFRIERSTSASGPFATLATVSSNSTSYNNTGLQVATTYYYRVFAINAGGDSAASNIASLTTPATFTWLQTNIFQPKCVNCHSGQVPKGTYDMSAYSLSGGTNGVISRVVSGNSAASTLYQKVLDGTMPKGGTPLTTDQLNALQGWIDRGAAND